MGARPLVTRDPKDDGAEQGAGAEQERAVARAGIAEAEDVAELEERHAGVAGGQQSWPIASLHPERLAAQPEQPEEQRDRDHRPERGVGQHRELCQGVLDDGKRGAPDDDGGQGGQIDPAPEPGDPAGSGEAYGYR